MACLCCLLLAVLGDLPQVQVDTLKTGQAVGELRQVTASQIKVGDRSIPLSEVLEVRFPAPPAPSTPATTSPATPVVNRVSILLNDGSRLTGSQATIKGPQLSLQSPELGAVSIRKNLIKSLRLAAADPKVEDAWLKLVERESKKDLIVVRKEDKLDFLAGVSGDIDPEIVKFLIDGEEVPVKSERVYGLIFNPAAATGKALASIDLAADVKLSAKQITMDGDKCQVILVSGTTVTVPLTQFRTIDFSLGKIRQLSQMKPSDVQYVPQFDVVWEYVPNAGPLKTPISLGGMTYPKGISIHSKTKLSFRLQSEYRRFQTTLGIDDLADDTGLLGDVHLKIMGDDKVLLEAEVKGPDEPRKVDLDVSGVRELQILVDFGGDLDIADWLSMGDAKVIK